MAPEGKVCHEKPSTRIGRLIQGAPLLVCTQDYPLACWLGAGDVQFARNKADRVLARLAETVLHCSKVGNVGRGSEEEMQFSEGADTLVTLQCDLGNYGFSSECDDIFQVHWF